MKKFFYKARDVLNSWCDRHYVWATIIQTLPSMWFVFLTWFGARFGFKDKNGNLTSPATWVSVFCFILLILIPVVRKVNERLEKSRISNEISSTQYSIDVLEKLLRSSTNIVRVKADRYTNLLPTTKIDINNSVKPKEQLNEILNEIEIILSELFGINRNDIATSIFYSFYKKGKPETNWGTSG